MPDCRGTLDANPERMRNYGREIEVAWDDGIYYEGIVVSYNDKSKKFSRAKSGGLRVADLVMRGAG